MWLNKSADLICLSRSHGWPKMPILLVFPGHVVGQKRQSYWSFQVMWLEKNADLIGLNRSCGWTKMPILLVFRGHVVEQIYTPYWSLQITWLDNLRLLAWSQAKGINLDIERLFRMLFDCVVVF